MNFQPDHHFPLAGLAFDQGHLISPVSCLRLLPLRGRDESWLCTELGCLLQHPSRAQHRLLIEGPSDELQAEWQALCGEASGKGDGRLSGQACWHSKDVVQI